MREALEPSLAWVEGAVAQLGFGTADERLAQTPNEALKLVGELAAGVHGEGPWFGGLAFPSSRGGWPGFPAARFVMPSRLESVPVSALPAGQVGAAREEMTPQWGALVKRATDAISAGAFEKVVLARSVDVPAPASAWQVFRALCAQAAARHFFFSFEGTAAFMGATPETLVRWRGGKLELDALAGSAPVGSAFTEKERREHDVVVRDVVAALAGLAVDAPAEPRVMELPYVRHLHTPIRAVTGAGFDFAALLSRLFPTSAVAGAPRRAALDFIDAHEGLARGWYAGAVGRIAPGDVDLAVALRCMLVEGAKARLFAGAGIVAGSDAQAEWDETARKMSPARRGLAAFRHDPAGVTAEDAGEKLPVPAAGLEAP